MLVERKEIEEGVKQELSRFLTAYFDRTGEKVLRFANRADVGHQTVYDAKDGKKVPLPPQLRKIARAMGISLGTMFLKAGYLDPEDLVGDITLRDDEEVLLEEYRMLPTRQDKGAAIGAVRGIRIQSGQITRRSGESE